MLTAITREVSSSLASCELTHLPRVPIDLERARAQHQAYERALTEAGCRVEQVPSGADMPDSVFVEDIAVAFDELAIITRPGAESRRIEVPGVAQALAPHRPLHFIVPPGTLDGGDVLLVGRRVFVGQSTRTNGDAIEQMRRILAPHGYMVCALTVRGCLHLKSAVTAVGDDVLLANPAWIAKEPFTGFDVVDVDPTEPMAANSLRIGDTIVYARAFPRTAERLARYGVALRIIDASELAKAEGALTCCSVILGNTDDQRMVRQAGPERAAHASTSSG